jgi:hypothetical protein
MKEIIASAVQRGHEQTFMRVMSMQKNRHPERTGLLPDFVVLLQALTSEESPSTFIARSDRKM